MISITLFSYTIVTFRNVIFIPKPSRIMILPDTICDIFCNGEITSHFIPGDISHSDVVDPAKTIIPNQFCRLVLIY